MYDVSEGFDAYKTYLALKQHFTSTYDYHKYNGKVRVNIESFLKRNDKFFFRKLQKKYNNDELVDFFVSNFITKGDNWIGNLVSQESEIIYVQWKKRSETLSYTFHNELLFLHDYCREHDLEFNKLILIENGGHPLLLKILLQNKMSLETLIILDAVLGFIEYWNKHLDDFIWEEKKKLILKYRAFMHYNLDKFKKITKDVFKE
jgi:hypothetical protein